MGFGHGQLCDVLIIATHYQTVTTQYRTGLMIRFAIVQYVSLFYNTFEGSINSSLESFQ